MPDVNVWVAMTFDSHTHHPKAKAWFDGLGDERVLFCRMTQQGFMRLVTNRKVFGQHALPLSGAWQAYDTYRADPRVGFADEPAGVEAGWRGFTSSGLFSPHVWNDAYLAAFAVAGGHTLVTFDAGFRQYAGLNLLLL